jgi:hypothetical protein
MIGMMRGVGSSITSLSRSPLLKSSDVSACYPFFISFHEKGLLFVP